MDAVGTGVYTGLGVLPGSAVITTSLPRSVGSTVGAGVSVGTSVSAGFSFLPQLQKSRKHRQSNKVIIRFKLYTPFFPII